MIAAIAVRQHVKIHSFCRVAGSDGPSCDYVLLTAELTIIGSGVRGLATSRYPEHRQGSCDPSIELVSEMTNSKNLSWVTVSQSKARLSLSLEFRLESGEK